MTMTELSFGLQMPADVETLLADLQEPGLGLDLGENSAASIACREECGPEQQGPAILKARSVRTMSSSAEPSADELALRAILVPALCGGNGQAVAYALITRFKTLGGVMRASARDLMSVKGVSKTVAALLKAIHHAMLRMLHKEVADQPVFSCWDQLINYLTVAMAYERREVFRVLFLNRCNGLIADEELGRGTIDHVPVYPREVVRRCLELDATSIILVHNHPSGGLVPSRDDVLITTDIAAAAAVLNIAVHDHLIISSKGYLSFRQEKLLD